MKKIKLPKVQFLFKWYDMWIGFFWDSKKNWLYILPIPCCGIIVKFSKETYKINVAFDTYKKGDILKSSYNIHIIVCKAYHRTLWYKLKKWYNGFEPSTYTYKVKNYDNEAGTT